ncbi:MAG: hypothetical protein QM756_44550 [Polyangiaceae bacterium]
MSVRGGRLWLAPRAGKAATLPSTLRGTFERGASGQVEYFVTRMGVARKRGYTGDRLDGP